MNLQPAYKLCFLVLFLMCLQSLLAQERSKEAYVDHSVKGLYPNMIGNDGFQLVTHGHPGELFIQGQWKNAAQIAAFLTKDLQLHRSGFRHLNIYGCEFAKDEKGRAALLYLQKTLGLTIAASDDITGRGGDWELEAGTPVLIRGLEHYQSSLQCPVATASNDTDGDGVPDAADVDDDNDGINDNVEGACDSDTSFVINSNSLGVSSDVTSFPASFTNVAGINGLNLTITTSGPFASPSPKVKGNGNFLNEGVNDGPVDASHTFNLAFSGTIAPRGIQVYSGANLFSAKGNAHADYIYERALIYYDYFNATPTSTAVQNANTCGIPGSYFYGSMGTYVNDFTGTTQHYFVTPLAATTNTIRYTCGFTSNFSAGSGKITAVRVEYQMESGGTYNNGVTQNQNFNVFLTVCVPRDTDEDGIPDHQDLDSDNDGIPDAIEAGGDRTLSLTNCRIPYSTSADTDANGDGCKDGNPSTTYASPNNTDGADALDYLDLDSDNDGCPDAVEAGNLSKGNVNTTEYEFDNATSDGLTNAGCSVPNDDDWLNSAVRSSECPLKEENLSATFGSFDAFIKDGSLYIRWQTLREENVSRFDIEASADGNTFNKIGSISSKAKGGSSDTPLQYERRVPLTSLGIMGLSVMLLCIGTLYRRRKWLVFLVAVAGIASLLYSCSRNDEALGSKNDKIYLRIKETDKDGSIKYSKTIKAIML